MSLLAFFCHLFIFSPSLGDGLIDEGITNGVLNSMQAGVCAGTMMRCISGSFVEFYSQYPNGTNTRWESNPDNETLCDGLDNNCNTFIDENLPVRLGSNQKGICNGSLAHCSGAAGWVDDDITLLPNFENFEVFCDGLDNNCDGIVDNTISHTCPVRITINSTSTAGGSSTTTDGATTGAATSLTGELFPVLIRVPRLPFSEMSIHAPTLLQ